MSRSLRQWMAGGDVEAAPGISKTAILVCDWPVCCEWAPLVKVALPSPGAVESIKKASTKVCTVPVLVAPHAHGRQQEAGSSRTEPWELLLQFQLFFHDTADHQYLSHLLAPPADGTKDQSKVAR